MQRTLSLAFKLPKMFRFNKTPDVLTLFHSPTSDSSNRILALLKTAQTPTSPVHHTTTTSTPIRFELDVVAAPNLPTPSQYRSIVDFLGGEAHAKQVLRGIGSVDEGARVLAEKEGAGGEGGEVDLVRPIVVDWNNGRVVVGGNEEEVRKLVETLPEDQ